EGTAVTITARRTSGPGAFSVAWAAIGGTATADSDYTPSSGLLSFSANDSTKSFMLSLVSDTVVEGSETVVLGLNVSSGTAMIGANASTVVTINDLTPSYSFTVLYEGAETVSLPSINDNQGFAFSVNEEVPTVYSGNLEAPTELRTVTELPDSGVQSLRGIRFPVDSGERVAFQANLTDGYGVVLDSNSSAPSVFFATGDGVDFVGEPSLS